MENKEELYKYCRSKSKRFYSIDRISKDSLFYFTSKYDVDFMKMGRSALQNIAMRNIKILISISVLLLMLILT